MEKMEVLGIQGEVRLGVAFLEWSWGFEKEKNEG